MPTALSTDEVRSSEQPCMKPPPSPDSQRAFLIVCIVVAIERFSFHVLFALYTLFLIAEHGHTEAQATWNFGLFLAVIFFTPFFGGAVADRVGRWPTILLGAMLLAAGYLALSLGLSVTGCLAVLAVGMGLFKGNLTALVGALYSQSQRDAAYSRFYWAVNLGALPSGVVGGWLSGRFGFRAAFLLCFIGMAVVLPIGIATRRLFHRSVSHEEIKHPASDSDRIVTILVLLPVAMLFFCAFYQSGSSLTLFAKNSTRPTLGGIPLTPPTYQSVQAALVLGLTPILTRLFRCWPVSTPRKLLFGMALTVLSCIVMADASVVASFGSGSGRVSPLWLLGSYFLISIAELCVSPIGFSLVSKLAPPRWAGLLMGLWLAAVALGNLATGLLGVLWERWSHAAFFSLLAGLSALAIPLLWLQQNRLALVLGKEES